MSITEEELQRLVCRTKEGDKYSFDRILKELEPDINRQASDFYIVGSEKADVLQECRIAIWKAVHDFDDKQGSGFRSFAINVCVQRHIISAVSQANRKKHDIMNNAVSLDAPLVVGDDEMQTLGDFIEDRPNPFELAYGSCDVTDQIIHHDEYNEMYTRLNEAMTPLEQRICDAYMGEHTYREIADIIGVKPKAVDNGMVRIRKKASTVFGHIEKKPL